MNGFVYVVLGVLVSFFSNRVMQAADAQGMRFFYYVGMILIAVGVMKIVYNYIKKEDESEKNVISCPSCGVRHYESSNYCHMCGTKLKKNYLNNNS